MQLVFKSWGTNCVADDLWKNSGRHYMLLCLLHFSALLMSGFSKQLPMGAQTVSKWCLNCTISVES